MIKTLKGFELILLFILKLKNVTMIGCPVPPN